MNLLGTFWLVSFFTIMYRIYSFELSLHENAAMVHEKCNLDIYNEPLYNKFASIMKGVHQGLEAKVTVFKNAWKSPPSLPPWSLFPLFCQFEGPASLGMGFKFLPATVEELYLRAGYQNWKPWHPTSTVRNAGVKQDLTVGHHLVNFQHLWPKNDSWLTFRPCFNDWPPNVYLVYHKFLLVTDLCNVTKLCVLCNCLYYYRVSIIFSLTVNYYPRSDCCLLTQPWPHECFCYNEFAADRAAVGAARPFQMVQQYSVQVPPVVAWCQCRRGV